MKALVRTCGLLAALVIVAATTGCYSPAPRSVRRMEPARDFEVVETSVRRPLTDREMSDLRRIVRDYLDKQQSTESGDYYLKVYFNATEPGAAEEWVVVRFTRYSETRYVARESYGSDSLLWPYYSWDLYPYGYGGFGRVSFQYYEDPFYRQRYYYPPRGRDRDHGHDKDPHHGGNNGNVEHGGSGPVPNNPPGNPRRPYPREPRTDRPGGVTPAADVDHRDRRPPNANPSGGNHDWRNRGGSDPRPSSPPSSPPSDSAPRYVPPPPPSYTPPPRYDPQPEHRSAPSSGDSRPVNDGHRTPEER